VPLLAHVRRARDHIDCNYREPLDLDGLARIAGISKYHFARSFEAALRRDADPVSAGC